MVFACDFFKKIIYSTCFSVNIGNYMAFHIANYIFNLKEKGYVTYPSF